MRKRILRAVVACFICLACVFPLSSQSTFPEGSTRGNTELGHSVTGVDFPNISLSATAPRTGAQVAFSVQLLVLLTLLTLAPSIFILATCFLRFSIVLDFIKRALSLQQVPPTAVLNGIALFMTLFCMWPTFRTVYDDAFKPLSDNEITLQEAYTKAEAPIRLFMAKQMNGDTSSLRTFMKLYNKMIAQNDQNGVDNRPRDLSDIPTFVLVPAYILHELTVAFKIGVLLYIPFIVIDMVVASILMSMGMMMLPPVQISMPFKLMLFVLVDGWNLLTQQLFLSVIK
ncbi:flagellar type III secretion system pore protein FliP [Treponema sp.]|uniref:flagellar type III secretion system pore protein FliP n=1 Tax=Treponema sp. TaxID=166 RepID=UPI00298E0EED|nr:flagellar type III secretion system pore protein FliP [Treponema sp.]MCQ2242009.1 flagellar type III secretion system pore protein FliP [Treponema sp.]